MTLLDIQAQLLEFYALRVEGSIEQFLISDRDLYRSLCRESTQAGREAVLIHSDEDDLSVSVYIDDVILEQLATLNYSDALEEKNLDHVLVALEGVSHFVYLAWNAQFDKQVTIFELELQAEIDKFLSIMYFIDQTKKELGADDVHEALFERTMIGDWVADATRERYLDANFYAAKYCWQILTAFNEAKPAKGLVPELRRFYRLPQNEKVRHINQRTPRSYQ